MTDRVSPFGHLGNLDDFTPVPVKEKKRKPAVKEVVDRVAADNDFPSRQPIKKEVKSVVRQKRRYVTGRNQQLNIKATFETIERFYRFADEENIPLGELFERVLDAFDREKATR